MKSLRLRLALASTAISGVVLVGFGLAGWTLTVRMLSEAVDGRLSVPLDRIARELHPRADIRRTFANLDIVFGDEAKEGKRLILVLGRGGEEIYRAPAGDWVAEISPEILESPQPDVESPGAGMERGGLSPGPDGRDIETKGPRPGGPGPPGEFGRPPVPPRSVEMPNLKFHTLGIGGQSWRAGVIREHGHLVLMATELSGFEKEIRQVRSLFFLSLPVCLLLIGLGGWYVAHRAMRPVGLISATAERITVQGLDQRIPWEAHDYRELSHLVDVLNGMMDRLERSFHHAMRFSADVSHELKTPLAVMQASVQTALQACAPGSAAERELLVVDEEAQRLIRITRSLMLLAQADAGQLAIRREDFSLSEEIGALCEDAEILCGESGLRFDAAIEPDLAMRSDAVLIRQALQNLVSNAVKYNRPGGFVKCQLLRDSGIEGIVFEISNSGPGIPKDDQARIFDRFFRSDRARSREVDGFGLGLNLAWEIIRALGGGLRLAESNEEATRFEVRFP